MKESESTRLLAILFGAFPNAKHSEQTAQVYRTLLADLDFEVAQRAVIRLLASAKFLPTIGEIRSCATDLLHGPVRPGGDAWGDVVTEIRRVGYIGSPSFSDPIVAHIVDRWGWRALCCEGSDVADRARFIELYDQLAASRRADVASGIPLPEPKHRVALEPRTQSGGLLPAFGGTNAS